MTTETMTPANRWNLDEIARVTVDDTEYVVYDDGAYSWAIEAERFDRPTAETDYGEWCQTESAEGNEELCQRIADAAGVGFYTAGACTPVKTIEDQYLDGDLSAGQAARRLGENRLAFVTRMGGPLATDDA